MLTLVQTDALPDGRMEGQGKTKSPPRLDVKLRSKL